MCLSVFVAAMLPSTGFGPSLLADKIAHGLSFTALTLWFSGAYEERNYRWLAISLLVLGIAIEVAQGQLSHRSAEAGDVIADATGILLGFLIANAGLNRWCLWAESILIRVFHGRQ